MRAPVLDEIISLDGPGDSHVDLCASCLSRESTHFYRCLECSHGSLFCGECLVKSHQALPLHRLEVWVPFPLHLSLCTNVIPSAGRTGSLSEPLSTHSDSSVILGTGVLPVPPTHNSTTSSSSTSMVGTDYESASVLVGQAPRDPNAIVNYYECAGILHHLTALEPPSLSIFLKHTTRLRCKEN